MRRSSATTVDQVGRALSPARAACRRPGDSGMLMRRQCGRYKGSMRGERTSPTTAGGIAAAPVGPQAETLRPLGRTGFQVLPVSLGGEGILRTTGRADEAVPVILEAIRLGVRYCDTAPAYDKSQDYYGEAFRRAGEDARGQIFLASKTHDRTRAGSLRLLAESLRRLGTSWLDLWQIHDLRTRRELDSVFKRGGAIEAVEAAKREGRVRFAGITGHHDPAILVEAMDRYDFDAVLCAINPADPRKRPFIPTVVVDARRRGMAVIGMKVLAAGRLSRDGAAAAELIRYAARHADTVIIGCSSIGEVRENLGMARDFRPLDDAGCSDLEARIAPKARLYDTFKR